MNAELERVTKIATTKGYRELWQKNVNEGMTQKDAFWEIEEEYRDIFGEKKYTSFQSFYMARYRDIKQRLSN